MEFDYFPLHPPTAGRGVNPQERQSHTPHRPIRALGEAKKLREFHGRLHVGRCLPQPLAALPGRMPAWGSEGQRSDGGVSESPVKLSHPE